MKDADLPWCNCPFVSMFQRFMILASTCLSLLFMATARLAAANDHPGAAIYKNLCTDCHGAQGQGNPEKYDEPLIGDRTLESLVKRIERTMPEDHAEDCVGEDARQVGSYIYDAFYSPAAQARLRPDGVDLARLTTSQYRESVADLLGHFRSDSGKDWGGERGLVANYRSPTIITPEELKKLKSNTRARRESVRHESKVTQVDFDWGDQSPVPEKLDPIEFTLRFEGSVIAPETGIYEFVVRSENGFRLWINDRENALIDAWVTSGSEIKEERASLFLLGGRAYNLSLHHFKFRDRSASLQLRWKAPHGVEEVIPTRHLSPHRSREITVVSTSFPPDDRSLGYERGTSVSKDWDQATTQAAVEVAEHIETRLDGLAGTKPGAQDRTKKLVQFAQSLVETAFRRPLDAGQKTWIEQQFAEAKTADLAVKRCVLFALKSPRFLFPVWMGGDQPDDFDVASRLALVLWDSIPDVALFAVAREGRLRTQSEILAQAQRMIEDPRARAKVTSFFHQ